MYENLIKYADQYQLGVDVLSQIYNFDQKIRFVDDQYGTQKLKPQQVIIRFLGNTGEIERKLEKDLNKFNSIEMEELFKSLNVVSNATFANHKTIIKKYFEWSFSEGLIKRQDFDWLSGFMIESMEVSDLGFKKYFKDFDDLKDGIDTLLDKRKPKDREQYAISCLTMYLQWCGLTVEQCCNLQIENIDFSQKIIKLDDNIYSVNEFVIEAISKSLKATGYITGSKSTKAIKTFSYKPSNYVIRRLIDADSCNYEENDLQQKVSTFISVANKLNPNNKYYHHTFYLKDIRDSGAYYRIFQYEKEKGITIDDLDRNILLGLLYVSDITVSKENNFKQDYKKWKSSFYSNIEKIELDC